MARTIVLIDGENFKGKIRSIFSQSETRLVWNRYDFHGLFDKILSEMLPQQRIFYFGRLTKNPLTKEKSVQIIEERRQLESHLKRQGFEVVLTGHVRGRMEQNLEGKKILVFREKGVDVKLAVDMVRWACDKKVDEIVLASSDSDLQPAISEIRERSVRCTYLGFASQPNRGMIYTTNHAILIKDSEVFEFANVPAVASCYNKIVMDAGEKTCQNCKNRFLIEPEDFDFYKKIGVPPPTFCSDCRLQRRISFRNERTLYKRKCNAPGHGEEILSVFSPDKPFTVYDDRYWWSDAWDPCAHGAAYDFNKPFFAQFRELLERVPLISLSVTNMSNSSYCNVAEGEKDCYLVSAGEGDERVRYSNRIVLSRDAQDIYIGDADELCYELVNCVKCYRTFFSFQCNECHNSAFLYDCTNCESCFGCTNLKNKSYHIFNQPYLKEECQKKMGEFDLGSYSAVTALRAKYEVLRRDALHRFAHNLKSVNVTGDNINQGKNIKDAFDIMGPFEDGRFLSWGGKNAKDMYDCSPGCGFNMERAYECVDSGLNANRLYFVNVVYSSSDVYYSINCHASKNLFGCYGIRQGEYCILNKKYSKEEYNELTQKIKKHMEEMPYVDAAGRVYKYGEYFPAETSPFAYNESIAQDYVPLTKERAAALKFPWREERERNYTITKQASELPDNIKEVTDFILQETIGCEHGGTCNEQCATAFRLTPDELEFYKHLGLPLPRLCFSCRHAQRLKMRNPMKLWHRACDCAGAGSKNGARENVAQHPHGAGPCPNEFETSYAPDRPEIVYCEQCYQAEAI